MGKSKRVFGSACFLLIAALCVIAGCSSNAVPTGAGDELQKILQKYPDLSADRAEKGTVKRVVDGDTFELQSGEKVRLIGVNTPEIHGKVQPFGQEAADYTEKELTGRSVILFPDVSGRDKYGRLLRYVFLSGEDVMFNERLVEEGYAQVMTVPPNVAYAEKFVQLQRDARSRETGLWGTQAGNAGKETNAHAPEASSADAPPACPNPIKGNINSKGDKIYHVPGGSSYRITRPERWFCSEKEAQDAGFRKAAR